MTDTRIEEARKISSLVIERDRIDAEIIKAMKQAVRIGPGKDSLKFARTVRGLSKDERSRLTKLKAQFGVHEAIREAEKAKDGKVANG